MTIYHRFPSFLAVIVSLAFVPMANADEIADLRAFFSAQCTKCHDAKSKKGGIDLGSYTTFKPENLDAWQDVLHNLERGDMPPKEAKQPTAEERSKAVTAIRAKLDRLTADMGSRDFRLTRLTNKQIAWSLRDILGIDRDYSADLVADPVGKHGQSVQSTLGLTGGHLEVYLSVCSSEPFVMLSRILRIRRSSTNFMATIGNVNTI